MSVQDRSHNYRSVKSPTFRHSATFKQLMHELLATPFLSSPQAPPPNHPSDPYENTFKHSLQGSHNFLRNSTIFPGLHTPGGVVSELVGNVSGGPVVKRLSLAFSES